MANSIRVSELDEYQNGSILKQLAGTDLFLIASNYNGELKSYKLSYDLLYNSLLNDISAKLKDTWENPTLILTSAEVLTYADLGDNIHAIGSKPMAELLRYCGNQLAPNLSMAYWS